MIKSYLYTNTVMRALQNIINCVDNAESMKLDLCSM